MLTESPSYAALHRSWTLTERAFSQSASVTRSSTIAVLEEVKRALSERPGGFDDPALGAHIGYTRVATIVKLPSGSWRH